MRQQEVGAKMRRFHRARETNAWLAKLGAWFLMQTFARWFKKPVKTSLVCAINCINIQSRHLKK
jgi:hypothetical protein